jgi:hypothetical protein
MEIASTAALALGAVVAFLALSKLLPIFPEAGPEAEAWPDIVESPRESPVVS